MALKVRKLIQNALIVHVIITAYMYTTPFVFDPRLVRRTEENEVFLFSADFFGRLLKITIGSSFDRFRTLPGIIYINGAIIFIITVLLENWFGIISNCLNLECCCLRKYISHQKNFSKDLYDDLQPEALH